VDKKADDWRQNNGGNNCEAALLSWARVADRPCRPARSWCVSREAAGGHFLNHFSFHLNVLFFRVFFSMHDVQQNMVKSISTRPSSTFCW